ncbi:MAG TPA: TolC family protein [Noviherbaspirillum sp.]|uniref:TolC family protein n=1 Tax=Noviherbaspirillum sp. TaxID=1926288 RepID=UPI002D55C365|nr:TolC family protein [Noviherbaspirillum sp.]HYD96483.1 TolC family protein [Noviherbaspirillum sp.]
MRKELTKHHLCFALALALGAASAPALAQSRPADLKAVLEAAWQRSPQARTLEARRDEAAAGREAAQSWIAGSPAVGLSQRTDRWTKREGVRETEVSLSTPIWLPSQKAVRRAQADIGTEDLEAQIANARLSLAGEVRERLWAVAAARETLDEAKSHQEHLEAMTEEVMRRVNAGDLARTDGMLAQQEALAGKAAVVEAQVKLQEALTHYTTLTGLSDVPQLEPERIGAEMRDPHPRLLAAKTAVRHAQASMNVVSKSRSEPPTVGVAMRRERDGAAVDAASSITFAVEIPIGTNARNRPLEAAARTLIATASAEYAQVEASLRDEVDLARRKVLASQQTLETASSRAALAREHARLIEKAFRVGERGLAEMLRARTAVHEAEVAERQQRVAVGLAHARLNQALGISP